MDKPIAPYQVVKQKYCGSGTLGRRRNLPATSVSMCMASPGPLLAWAYTLAHPRVPEGALFTNLRRPSSLH